MISTKKKIISFVITIILLVLLFFFSVNTGSIRLSYTELLRGLFIKYNESVATVYDLRFPRIFIAILGGAAVAVSGTLK